MDKKTIPVLVARDLPDDAQSLLEAEVDALVEPDGGPVQYAAVLGAMAERLNTWREGTPKVQALHEQLFAALRAAQDMAQALERAVEEDEQ